MAINHGNKSALVVLAVIILFVVGTTVRATTDCGGGTSDEFGYANAVSNVVLTLARETPSQGSLSYDYTYNGMVTGSASCSTGTSTQECTQCLERVQAQLQEQCSASKSASGSQDGCQMSFSQVSRR